MDDFGPEVLHSDRDLELSEEKARLKQLLHESRRKAEKVGFTLRDIQEFIQRTRKAS